MTPFARYLNTQTKHSPTEDQIVPEWRVLYVLDRVGHARGDQCSPGHRDKVFSWPYIAPLVGSESNRSSQRLTRRAGVDEVEGSEPIQVRNPVQHIPLDESSGWITTRSGYLVDASHVPPGPGKPYTSATGSAKKIQTPHLVMLPRQIPVPIVSYDYRYPHFHSDTRETAPSLERLGAALILRLASGGG